MVASSHIVPGMVISLESKLYHVDSYVKVTVPKGAPFIKAKLREFETNKPLEKNFRPNQTITVVPPSTRRLEFLYIEKKNFLFMDIDKLEQVLVSEKVVGDKVNFLKEGIEVVASFYGEVVISNELPQFLELMVTATEGEQEVPLANAVKFASLETGAQIEVPHFIEIGDIIKVDTNTSEYIQRV